MTPQTETAVEIQVHIDDADWFDLADAGLVDIPEHQSERFSNDLWTPSLDYLAHMEELASFRGRGMTKARAAFFPSNSKDDLSIYTFEKSGREWLPIHCLSAPRDEAQYPEIDDHPAAEMASAWVNHQIQLEA